MICIILCLWIVSIQRSRGCPGKLSCANRPKFAPPEFRDVNCVTSIRIRLHRSRWRLPNSKYRCHASSVAMHKLQTRRMYISFSVDGPASCRDVLPRLNLSANSPGFPFTVNNREPVLNFTLDLRHVNYRDQETPGAIPYYE